MGSRDVLASTQYAVCSSYFGSNSGQNSAIHTPVHGLRRGKLLSFTCLLEHTHTAKKLLLKLSTIGIACY